MATTTPMMSFLRPLSLPRPATIRHFLRFSTTSQCQEGLAQVAKREGTTSTDSDLPGTQADIVSDPNLIASRTASPSYPPASMKSLPRPKESRASRRTNYPRSERNYPTRQPTHATTTFPKLIPDSVEPLAEELCAPNLAYYVKRSRFHELPVYTLKKRGGNLKLTQIKNIDGEPGALRDGLREALGLEKDAANVNPTTKHVILKGHHKPAVDRYLRERKF